MLEGPVLITNTNSVGVVRDAVIEYAARRWPPASNAWDWTVWSLPIVAETWDGGLNDIYGMHVRKEHAFQAIERAASGPVAEGGVGGGTGMVCYEFKGGIGTSSRRLTPEQGGHTLGVLVQANFGQRHQLRIAGVPLGLELRDGRRASATRARSSSWSRPTPRCCRTSSSAWRGGRRSGSPAPAAWRATARATCSWPSAPRESRTPARTVSRPCPCSRTSAWERSSRPPSPQPRKPSSTRSSPGAR